ncbi:type II toxin-antitoxin system death-on-curing family toxin [Candidatus Woesearchaeota archaeon]|nr:type II toxin-antitoxin system death-on-curing family toxin [Candidatus Woesearchaeota archaeon]
MTDIIYPTPERIVEYNVLVLEIVKVKKADNPKVLSTSKLREAIAECEDNPGDVYDKAAVLMKGLVQKHPFASGNRRTAFVATKEFILKNNAKFAISDDPDSAKVMQGLRENYYSHEELKEWIQHGKIRGFKR